MKYQGPMYHRIAALPRNKAGYPIPWFVADGTPEPDFRIVPAKKVETALKRALCWVCGQKIVGQQCAFVVGPMCSVNGVSAEPPSHTECALFAAKACPFLTMPKMRRREGGLPDEVVEPPGIMIRGNPGVALVWVNHFWQLRQVVNGFLFQLGPPSGIHWFAQGRPATRQEVLDAMEAGIGTLRKMATDEGPRSARLLEKRYVQVLRLYLPAAAPGPICAGSVSC